MYARVAEFGDEPSNIWVYDSPKLVLTVTFSCRVGLRYYHQGAWNSTPRGRMSLPTRLYCLFAYSFLCYPAS
ncbi:hypothetical protein SCLCIDRAFT_1224720 [Scleroderma citrinum Foug A]|uniref:Uncharacterized protein n=1 Tax=Scleroderma citrinum Foug A TaxID=1036808 RepID=A0A0C3CRH7_9AGAM|nr:hypothetical protein SCLCIDRAFT_1224720 [Scleroderma citrinum Foug A]